MYVVLFWCFTALHGVDIFANAPLWCLMMLFSVWFAGFPRFSGSGTVACEIFENSVIGRLMFFERHGLSLDFPVVHHCSLSLFQFLERYFWHRKPLSPLRSGFLDRGPKH